MNSYSWLKAAGLAISRNMPYLQGESGSERVEAALDHSVISTVNLAEVLTVALHKRGEPPSSLRPQLLALGIQAIDFTIEDAQEAAALWTQTRTYGLALGDRACLALGKRLRAKVLTAETHKDWRKLGLKGRRRSIDSRMM